MRRGVRRRPDRHEVLRSASGPHWIPLLFYVGDVHDAIHQLSRQVTLLPIPEHRKKRIVVGTTVRKPLPILQAYLASLDWQERDKQTVFEYCFVPDFSA